MDQTAQNLQQQVELYGEPLGEVVRRVTSALDLTQGGLAQVLGLSAPMLSQLVSAHRVKIGNPAVVSRLRAVSELADAAIADVILPNKVAIELDHIRLSTGAYANTTTRHLRRQPAGPAGAQAEAPPEAGAGTVPGAGTGAPRSQGVAVPFGAPTGLPVETPAPAWQGSPAELPARSVVREIQDLFRAVASADEIQRAAARAAEESPAVAELLLAYGTGRTADAIAHYDRHHG